MKFVDTAGDPVDGANPDRAQEIKPTRARKTSLQPPVAAALDVVASAVEATAVLDANAAQLDPAEFRRLLMGWYRAEARELPWRGTKDPYHIWVSEIMLQQTRVAAVIDHYNEFLRRFPTLISLSLAPEADVLAAWSGLGYYRRARMLHRAAQFIMLEREGRLPTNAVELRTLPGIGEYTAAAIASIAFGEAVAVVDGNVERVILRLTGRPDEATAAARAFIRAQAQALIPGATALPAHKDAESGGQVGKHRVVTGWDAAERAALAASLHPTSPVGGEEPRAFPAENPFGEHNQAMMELGAMVCLPRVPLCAQCPVHALCRTRGEHITPKRAPQRSLPVAYLLDLRKKGSITEVLLEHRAARASVMPGMYELPPLPLEAVEGREPVLRVRHAITNTNYYVQVFAPQRNEPRGSREREEAPSLRRALPKGARGLLWVNVSRLPGVPITGLTRKILQRLHVMENPRISLLD